MHVPTWAGYFGLAVTVAATGISLMLAFRHRSSSLARLAGLGLAAGAGDAAWWGSRVGSMNPVWWIVAAVAGALLGAAPLLVARWLGSPARVRIGTYSVDGIVGSGASGTVYRAHDDDGHAVAIKVLAPEWMDDEEFRARFRDEATLMRALDHPNCVRVREILDDDVIAAIVVDYVDGASLRAMLRRSGPLGGEQAAAVFDGALAGLEHVHARGMVHRDIKPDNILVDRAGVSRLVDFGLARDVGAFAQGSEASVGSPAYMSPEQVRGEPLDARTDIYSCGAVLFEVLTGQRPYVGATPAAVMDAHLGDPVPDPRSVRPQIPEALALLTMSALAKDPAARPGSAAQFRENLTAAARQAYGPNWQPAAMVGAVAALAAGGATAAIVGAGTVSAAGAALAPVAGSSTVGATVASGTVAGGTVAGGTSPAAPPGPSAPRSEPPSHAADGPKAPAEPGRAAPPRRTSALVSVVVSAIPVRIASRPPVVAGVVAVLTAVTLVGAAAASPSPPPLASCIVGTWAVLGGPYDDVWSQQPVLVNLPPSPLDGDTRYNADGTAIGVSPPGGPPATGVLNGAPFIDTGYGTSTWRWATRGEHTLLTINADYSHSVSLLYAGYDHTLSQGVPLQTGIVPTQVTCTATRLTIFDSFTYHGHVLTSTQNLRRLPAGAELPPASIVPSQAGLLGGAQLDSYCASLGFSMAAPTKPLLGPGDGTGNWTCTGAKGTQPVDMNAACQWQFYYHSNVTARLNDPNDAVSWLCYGGPAMTFTISPSSGGAKTVITMTSQTACPAGSQIVIYDIATLVPQADLRQGGPIRLQPDGSWQGTAQVGSFQSQQGQPTPSIPAGDLTIEASCQSSPNANAHAANYMPVTFHFTGS
ncbi:MAG TPA: serine/threonine-protein kinase [Mycobacteriales bacterium]|nr:serine/threonine-protein kinase [Mycobacteriales bacterium]